MRTRSYLWLWGQQKGQAGSNCTLMHQLRHSAAMQDSARMSDFIILSPIQLSTLYEQAISKNPHRSKYLQQTNIIDPQQHSTISNHFKNCDERSIPNNPMMQRRDQEPRAFIHTNTLPLLLRPLKPKHIDYYPRPPCRRNHNHQHHQHLHYHPLLKHL